MVSRADFLKICGGALCAPGANFLSWLAPPSFAAAPGAPTDRLALDQTSARFFRQYLNTTFHVTTAGGTRARMELARVTDRPVTHGIEQFSLIFHAPAGTGVADGTHAVQHRALGTFDLFIVQIGGSSDAGDVLEACCSHRVTIGGKEQCQTRS